MVSRRKIGKKKPVAKPVERTAKKKVIVQKPAAVIDHKTTSCCTTPPMAVITGAGMVSIRDCGEVLEIITDQTNGVAREERISKRGAKKFKVYIHSA